MNLLSKNILIFASISSLAQAGTVLRLNVGTVESKRVEGLMSTQGANVTAPQELIIQFKKIITERDKAELKALGAEVFGYLPDDALMVRAPIEKIQQWRSHKEIEAVLPFKADYKVSPSFGAASIFNKEEQTAILVKTFKKTETQDIAVKIKNLAQSAVHFAGGKSILAVVPRGMVRDVASIQGVEHVQPYVEMKPMHMVFDEGAGTPPAQGAGDYSDLNGFETGTKVMNFDAAWSMGYKGRGQIVSMADTGLDMGENQLTGDFKDAVIKGYIFGLFSKAWDDPMGHGTHVAGSILGRGVVSGGKIHGGAYEASFIPEGMWSPMMKNLTVPSKIEDLFTKAYA
ncbi:MAG: S8 family serine peptidase, partial [Pseudobdellovibrionaceae bacterium]